MWLGLLLLACTGSDPDPSDTDPSGDTTQSQSDTQSSDTQASDTETDAAPQVVFTTTMGVFTVALNPEASPITVENFLAYVDSGHFDGDDGLGATIFHRVVNQFVVQGGGYTEDGVLKDTLDAIELESDNGLSNVRGTIAMARTSRPDSATCQFYINTVDNEFLDYSSSTEGYAVFGEVIDGMDIIDAIDAVDVDGADAPLEAIVMTDVERVE